MTDTPQAPHSGPERQPVARLRAVLADLPEELRPPEPGSPPGRILAATRALLAAKGPAALSMRLVAAQAGVNQAMIHYYFGSKERLLDAVVMQEMLQMIRDLVTSLDADLAPPELFATYPVKLLEALRKDPLRLSLLRLAMTTEPERLRRVVRNLGRHGMLGLTAALREMIGESQSRGELADVPPLSLILFLIANAHGLVFMAPLAEEILGFRLEDDAIWEEHRRALSTLIRRGILAPQDEEAAT